MKSYLQHKIDLSDPNLASVFDELSFWSSRFGNFLYKNIPLRRGINILDLGCGSGFPLIELAQTVGDSCRVTGIDIWKEGLNRAKKKIEFYKLENVKIVESDGAKQPFKDSEFDLIVSNLGLNNFSDPQAALFECYRVAKSEATIALTTNIKGHMQEFYDLFREILIDLNKKEYLDKLSVNENHRGTKESICELLQNCGFNIVRVIEEKFQMRYLDSGALFNHSLTWIGFLDGWRSAADPEDEEEVFDRLEKRLNSIAEKNGELRMTVPMVYIEGKK
jgi:arsenite methyltransferase